MKAGVYVRNKPAQSPGLAPCLACKASRLDVQFKLTWFRGIAVGCSPLCERCWLSLTCMQRMAYYMALVDSWEARAEPEARHYVDKMRQEIRTAVIGGK